MDPKILEISAICSTETSAIQFAQNHGLFLNDQSIQTAQQPAYLLLELAAAKFFISFNKFNWIIDCLISNPLIG